MADDNLQRMYEYHELKGNSGSEYVVRGAEVVCGYGGSSCVLNLPGDHGVYTSDGRPLITVSDTKAENIKGFGTCKINKRNSYRCELKLGTWSVVSNKDMKIKDPATGKIEYAVECSATALCLKGGVVKFKTSGQTSPSYKSKNIPDAVEIVEDVKGSWIRTANNKDFLGYIKVANPGLYNFGIGFQGNSVENVIGSIFLYEANWGKLKFIGSYKINKFNRGNNNGFKWKYAADIELKSDRFYYFEIDCPSLNEYEYILTGNQEQIISNNLGMAKWTMSNTCKDWFVMNVGIFTMKQSIMYLDKAYATILRNSISDYLVRKSIDTDWGDIIKEALKTVGITGIGIEDTPMGIALTAWDFIVTNFDKSDIELFWSELDVYVKKTEWETKLIKVLIYEKNSSIALSTGYGVDKRIEISLWYENNRVVGEKYLWGELTKYDSVGTIEDYTNGEKNVKEGIINQNGFVN